MTTSKNVRKSERKQTEMKLSEAILRGAKVRDRQAIGTLYSPEVQGTCALGAAVEGFFNQKVAWKKDEKFTIPGNGNVEPMGWLRKTFGKTLDARVRNSDGTIWRCINDDCGADCPTVEDIVVHLNDDHSWPRPKIARCIADLGF